MASDNNHSILDLRELTPEDIRHERMCAELNDIVGGYIVQKYPGYPWGINADVRNGIVNIYLNIGNGGRAPYGVTVKIDAQAQVMLKKCELFCGELLERYGLNRGKMLEHEILAKVQGADFAGRFKIDED